MLTELKTIARRAAKTQLVPSGDPVIGTVHSRIPGYLSWERAASSGHGEYRPCPSTDRVQRGRRVHAESQLVRHQ
jgi:hypothetical protein